MKRKELLEDIQNFFKVDGLTPSTGIGDIPQWDSLGHLALFMALEEKYGKKFSPEEMTSAKNVADIDRLLDE